ncbi:HTH domain-containing protein [Natrarchaeobius chitinivorans]|uniref:Uncharacterized protein n=1 Tax=Natrarchaeobius chitinivorans TaxID=1679083 RepID=A0A3N6N9I0_NATCH|nr:HTH domain-containing protein [Natrarchaeobius chitinivorans]RQG95192.1 hypothetical protein EA473_09610 [Natrarchaeobius chitinivorans]
MPASESTVTESVAAKRGAGHHVTCYVRSSVPGAVTDALETITGRLRRLEERNRIGGYRVVRWPPAHRTLPVDGTRTREDLFAEFERWAERTDCTLEPAFRRRPSTPSPIESDRERDADEQLRVPIVALVVYEGDGSPETDDVREVVPHTERRGTGERRTTTVDDWLTEAESGRTGPPPRATPRRDRVSTVDGR